MTTDFEEAIDTIGWCEHGNFDGDFCEHCRQDADAAGRAAESGANGLRLDGADANEAPQLPWHLMVLTLTTTMTPPEPAMAGPRRRYLAQKDEGDDAYRPAAVAALPVKQGPASFVPCGGVVRCCPGLI